MSKGPRTKPPVVQHQAETLIELRLRLPSPLVDLIEEQGLAKGRMLDEEIHERLKRCLTYTADKPLYFDDKQRRRLEDLLGHLVQHPDIALQQLEHLVQLKVGEVDVDIDSQLLNRLSTRTFGKTLAETIQREALRGLRAYAGLE